MHCLLLFAALLAPLLQPAATAAAPVPGLAVRAELPVGTAVVVTLNDGKVYTGTIKQQDAASITLETTANNQMLTVQLQRADIEEIRKRP